MAVANEIPMLVDLYKNNNTESKGYGMYYPRIFKRSGLNLKGFAKHISEHGSLVKYDLAVLVLQNIISCPTDWAPSRPASPVRAPPPSLASTPTR